ncbi:MAG: CAF17-like 4Fe-4S cluster assembly/insertion protein YgfZ [Mycobacteriales bacterium]
MTTFPLLGGAVAADPPDTGVAAHYGDPLKEQRQLTESVGLVDRTHRDALTVSGADRLEWLHSLTSQHVSALPPNRVTEALVLDPHGHVEHHLVMHDDGFTTWLDLEPGTAAQLATWLESMRFLLRVDVAVPAVSTVSLAGTELAGLLPAVGLPIPALENDVLALPTPSGPLQVRRRAWPGSAVDLLLPSGVVDEWVGRLLDAGAAPAGIWAWEALRVAGRHPRLGWETDHRTIPHEVGWIGEAVHLDKGCYRGQETVARVHNLGRPPRRMVLLHLDGSDSQLPAHGADVTWEGARIGFLGTSARHFEWGPIGLAVVKRTVPDDAALLVGGVPAAIDH